MAKEGGSDNKYGYKQELKSHWRGNGAKMQEGNKKVGEDSKTDLPD